MTALDSAGFTVTVDTSVYPPPSSTEQAWLQEVQSILEYDTVKQRPATNAVDVYILSNPAAATWKGDEITVSFANPSGQGIAKGQWLILRHQVWHTEGKTSFFFAKRADATKTSRICPLAQLGRCSP